MMSKRRMKGLQGAGPTQEAQVPVIVQLVRSAQQAEEFRLARQLERARSICAKVIKQDPDYVAGLFTMGLIQADAGKYEEAVRFLHRAVTLNPDDPKIPHGIEWCLFAPWRQHYGRQNA